MIPTKKHELEVTSTLDGAEIGMSIDENSLHHIMSVLTDLYSDPELAIIREYSTNALDAHKLAGTTEPIEVYTPTSLHPALRIVDHGVGLDADDIRDIYSKYGLSTKTESNDFNGVLGLGCKSALTYSSQFTVVGIKDGIRTTVSVSRDEEGVGTMTILDSVPTDERNGVTVSIATKRYNEIESKAKEFFRYWKKGEVLLNGEEPKHITGMPLGDNMILEKLDRRSSDESMVVMGNVAYPFTSHQFTDILHLPDGYRLIAYVPIGCLHFTPSRESLHYTARTKEVLNQIVETFETDLAESISKEIEAQPTKADALNAAVIWSAALPASMRDNGFMYRGTELPLRLKPLKDGDVFTITLGKEEKDYFGKRVRVTKASRESAIDIAWIPDSIFIYGFDQGFSAVVKHKCWQWCEENNTERPERFIFSNAKAKSPWLDSKKMVKWEKVKAIKLPRYAKTGGRGGIPRIPGSYDMIIDGKTHIEKAANDIDTTKPLFYCHSGSENHFAKFLNHVMDEYTLVHFQERRTEKFRRLFPMAEPCDRTLITEHAEAWWDLLRKIEKQALMIQANRHQYRHLDSFTLTSIKDPKIRRVLEILRLDVKRHALGYELFRGYLGEVSIPADPTSRYPLISRYNAGNKKHQRIYVNAVYQELYENAKA